MIKVSNLTKRFGGTGRGVAAVDGISFDVEDGSFVTLLGPSGCGKTTTLRLLAGLERPTSGSIFIDQECMCSAEGRVFQPTHRRPIGMVFQSYAIWPHMTVNQNVAFPLRVARPRVPKKEIEQRVAEVLTVVGLEDLGGRMSTELSGGQQQRVALARALIRNPKILLLDEPLSNLDAELRERMRDEVREMQQRLGITTIFVTHDQSEALALSDRIIVMNRGHIEEAGLPQEIYSFPRRSFTARFLGVSNNFSGRIVGRDGAMVSIATEFGMLTSPASDTTKIGDEVAVAMRPDSFAIHGGPVEGATWRGSVRFAIYHGESWSYHIDLGSKTIKIRSSKEKIGLRHGDEVFLQPEAGAAVITSDDEPRAEPAGDGDEAGPAAQLSAESVGDGT